MYKWIKSLLLIILICMLISGCTTGNSSETGSSNPTDIGSVQSTVQGGHNEPEIIPENSCYLYTPQMVEDSFRYLDEVYIENFPEMGLRWEHGTAADMRIMTAFANQLTQDCSTTREAVDVFYDWIVSNVQYQEYSSPFSSDVLYEKVGNCSGMAMLLRDLCRVVGIPAVYGNGFRDGVFEVPSLKTFTVEEMYELPEGHAWCFVYLDNEWRLYDPLFSVKGTTDHAYIAEHYFLDQIGGVTPIYDENSPRPFRYPDSINVYIDGRFMFMSNGQITQGGTNDYINAQMVFESISYADYNGFFYVDLPGDYYEGILENELYSNGWITYGIPNVHAFPISYAYENGIFASETVINRNGVDHYILQGNAFPIYVPQESYRMQYGMLMIETGYCGKIWDFPDYALPPGNYEYHWETDNPAVATVDENGVVTSYKSGSVFISCTVTGTYMVGNEEWPLVDYHHSFPVFFKDNISRPSEFAALDPGGPASIEIISTGIGPRELTPYFLPMDDSPTLPEPTDELYFGESPMLQNPITRGPFLEFMIEYGTLNGDILSITDAQDWHSVEFSSEPLQAILDLNYQLSFPLVDGTITLDQQTINTLLQHQASENGALHFAPVEVEWCAYPQQDALRELNAEKIYSLHCEWWAENGIINDLQGGKITVTIPVDSADGNYRVYFVDGYGNTTEIPSSTENGTLTFQAPYFATYAIVNAN